MSKTCGSSWLRCLMLPFLLIPSLGISSPTLSSPSDEEVTESEPTLSTPAEATERTSRTKRAGFLAPVVVIVTGALLGGGTVGTMSWIMVRGSHLQGTKP